MVMTHPPAFCTRVCKFLMKNMIPTNNGLTAGALLSFIKVVSYVLLVLIKYTIVLFT